jgi:hypothetical protein
VPDAQNVLRVFLLQRGRLRRDVELFGFGLRRELRVAKARIAGGQADVHHRQRGEAKEDTQLPLQESHPGKAHTTFALRPFTRPVRVSCTRLCVSSPHRLGWK